MANKLTADMYRPSSFRKLSRTHSASDLIRNMALKKCALPAQDESPGDSSDEDEETKRYRVIRNNSKGNKSNQQQSSCKVKVSVSDSSLAASDDNGRSQRHRNDTRTRIFCAAEARPLTVTTTASLSKSSVCSRSSASSASTTKRNNNPTQVKTDSCSFTNSSSVPPPQDSFSSNIGSSCNQSSCLVLDPIETSEQQPIAPKKVQFDELVLEQSSDKREESEGDDFDNGKQEEDKEECPSSSAFPGLMMIECEEPTDDESVISSAMDFNETTTYCCFGGIDPYRTNQLPYNALARSSCFITQTAMPQPQPQHDLVRHFAIPTSRFAMEGPEGYYYASSPAILLRSEPQDDESQSYESWSEAAPQREGTRTYWHQWTGMDDSPMLLPPCSIGERR